MTLGNVCLCVYIFRNLETVAFFMLKIVDVYFIYLLNGGMYTLSVFGERGGVVYRIIVYLQVKVKKTPHSFLPRFLMFS